MKTFVSWSGELSRKVAELLSKWLPCVMQNADTWISTDGIGKGEIWFNTISEKLSAINTGIICLTRENVNAPWILFESGAIAKGVQKNRVCTLLIDLDTTELKPPLSLFNATRPTQEDMLRLVKTINASLGEKALSEQRIEESFKQWWGKFESELAAIIKQTPSQKAVAKRSPEDMTIEVLETVRNIQRLLQQQRGNEVRAALEALPPSAWSKLVEITADDIQPVVRPAMGKMLFDYLSKPPSKDSPPS